MAFINDYFWLWFVLIIFFSGSVVLFSQAKGIRRMTRLGVDFEQPLEPFIASSAKRFALLGILIIALMFSVVLFLISLIA